MGERVGGFAEVMRERVRRAQAAVARARAADDAFELAVAIEELEDATQLARENGVSVDAQPEAEGS